MEGGEGLAFCGVEGGIDLVEGEADVLVGLLVEDGVMKEMRDLEEVIVGCHLRGLGICYVCEGGVLWG